MTTGEVMDMVASLMNDTAKTVYNYSAVLPYLNMSLTELQELFELNNIPITNETSAVIATTAGDTAIGFATTPALPADLVEIQKLWESPPGENRWIPVTRVDFLPHYLEDTQINQFIFWAWIDQEIRVLEADGDIDLKLDYIKSLFTLYSDINGTDTIEPLNVKSYLGYRTAGLCSEFIGENKTRADALNFQAEASLQRSLGISTKGRQATTTRRRPFRSAYKNSRIV